MSSLKKLVYISAHDKHINFLIEYSKIILKNDPTTVPFIPYMNNSLLLPFDDISIFFEKKSFDELWIIGDYLTDQTIQELKWAIENGIPIVFKDNNRPDEHEGKI